MTTPLYACLWARQFAAQALLRLRPELQARPVAVLEGERPLERVCSANRAARALGVRQGMSRSEADTFEIPLLRRSLSEERSAKSALLALYSLYTPRIEERGTVSDCVHVLDLGGTERLFGAALDVGRRIRRQVKELGVALQIAISDNFHTSVCMAAAASMARRSQVVHVPAGQERESMRKLPLAVLQASAELSPEHEEIFHDWGLKTCGDLSALPEAELIARLGQQGRGLRLLARGEHPHHFDPVEAEFSLEESFEFDSPVELLDSLLFALNPMVEQLLLRAGARALALASLDAVFQLEGGTEHRTGIRPALPTQDRPSLLKLLQLELAAHPPPAAVLALRLRAEPGPVGKVQLGLFSPQSPEPMRLEVTLARIAAIVGEGHAGKAILADTHRPDAHTMAKFSMEQTIRNRDAPDYAASPALRWLRPPLDLGSAKSCPESLWYQNAGYRIERLYGPWTVSGDWWSGDAWAVDSWDFAARSADGALLLGILSRDRLRQGWRLEAVYD